MTTTTTIKKESSSSTDVRKKMYPVGTLLAVNLFGDDNYFEAKLKSYNRSANSKGKNCLWATMNYLHDGSTNQIDLNLLEVVDLSQESIIKLDDDDDDGTKNNNKRGNVKKETNYLGRRVIVQWNDGKRYPGVVAKVMKDKKDFVYIKYDDGDDCWYTLDPSKQKRSQKKSTNLEEKYQIGSRMCVAYHHDGHYYDCIVKKYHSNTSLLDKGQEWVFVHFCDSKIKEWIDLKCVPSVKVEPDKIVTLDTIDDMNGERFLGKRKEIQWSNGMKYSGIVTRRMKYDENFVYIEYDDGDKCWCDLNKEIKQENGTVKKKAKLSY